MKWTKRASLVNGPDRGSYQDDKKFLTDTYKFVQENFRPGTWLTQEFDGELVGHDLITDEGTAQKMIQEAEQNNPDFPPIQYTSEEDKNYLLSQIKEDLGEVDY
jgi:hypothetical protein